MIKKRIFQVLTALTVMLSLCCSVQSVAIRPKSKKSPSKKFSPREMDPGDYFLPEYRPSSEIASDVIRSLMMNDVGDDSAQAIIGGNQMSPDQLMSLMKKPNAYAMLPLVTAEDKTGDVPEDVFKQLLMSRPDYALMSGLMSKGTKVRGDALMSALASRSAKSGAGVKGLKPGDWLKLLMDCLQQLTETLDDYDEMPKLWTKNYDQM